VARRALAAALAIQATAALALGAAVPTAAEISQRGTLRVSFLGGLRPTALPRHGRAPIAVSVSSRISTTDQSNPPQLRRIALALNRHGHIDTRGLPRCRLGEIQPATSDEALRNCRPALIGSGRFLANVALPEQSPFPSNGRVLAFNGVRKGRPVVYAHIYGTDPLPTSYVLPFELKRSSGGGTYGTTLVAELPRIAAEWGFISGVELTLKRRFQHGGRQRSYLSAGCPAPRGFNGAVFPLANASFAFQGGHTLDATLTRHCQVRG
jgi:hypothetical protein